jgi:hypothetical protein
VTTLQLVIDRKRIFLFRPKTNIRQKAVNIAKMLTKMFSGMAVASCSQLSRFMGNKNTQWHKTLTMSNRCLFSLKNGFEIESYKMRLFSFSAAPAEYSFRPIIRPINVFGRSLTSFFRHSSQAPRCRYTSCPQTHCYIRATFSKLQNSGLESYSPNKNIVLRSFSTPVSKSRVCSNLPAKE